MAYTLVNEKKAPAPVLKPVQNRHDALASNEDKDKQAPPPEAPDQPTKTLEDFGSLSSTEVSLVIFLRCHSIGSPTIGRILVLERTRNNSDDEAATSAVRATLSQLKEKDPITMEAARKEVAEIANRAVPGYQWHLTQARAWHAEANHTPIAGTNAKTAAKMRMMLKKFRYKTERDPKLPLAKAFPAVRAEAKAKEEFFKRYGYIEGEKQGLKEFLLAKIQQLLSVTTDE